MSNNEIRIEAQDLNQQAVMLIKANSLEAAKEKIEKAIDLDPMLMDSYKNYGDYYMALQLYENAKNMYKKALLIEKKGELYFLYGNACFMLDEVHDGLEYYNLALSAGFDNEDMLFFMGMAYEHLNDDQMALRYFTKATQKNPSRPDFLVKKITTLIRLDMLDVAEENAEQLIANSPELFDGYHIKSKLLINKGAIDEALAFSKAASEKFPEDVDLLFDYVRSITVKGDYEKALNLIQNAKKMKYFEDSKRSFVMLEAQIAADVNNIERAIECCLECIELENNDYFDSEARFMLMNMYLTYPKFDEALNMAVQLCDNDAEDLYYYAALYYRAFCSKQLNNETAGKYYKEANSIYRLATLKKPEALDIYLYRAMCLKDMEEYDKALDILDFMNELTDDIAEIYTVRAEIYKLQGNNILANEQFEKAYSIKPELKNYYGKTGE